jgi:ABC-type transporter Mla subunit MlaD
MTDEQCQALIDSLDRLTDAVHSSSSKIENAIDSIYTTSTTQIEREIHLVAELIEDIAIKL